MGIERLHEYDASSSPDVDGVLVEFCINDYQLVVDNDFRFWEASYEGLVRHCLRTFPGKPVVSVLLGRQAQRFQRRQGHIKRRIWRLTRHYRNHYSVDIDDMLRQAHPEHEQFERLYVDSAHFTAGATQQISQFLSDALADIFAKHEPEHSLPQKTYYEHCFDKTEVVRLTAIDRSKFSNSRMSYDVPRLQFGSGQRVTLPGRAISLSYISSGDSGTLDIEFENERSSIHTLMAAVARGRFPFLLKNTALNWRPLQPAAPEPLNLQIASGAVSDDRLKYQFNMIPPVVDRPSAYPVSVLCDVTPSEAP